MSAGSFIEGIRSYDIHTYWYNNNKEEREAALLLREKVLNVFAKEIEAGDIRVYKPWETPIGPHPLSMWELDFKSPAIFSRIVPFFQMHHHKLSVLIHPRTSKGDLLDHTVHALWLGHKVRLDTTLLK
ncbi:Piso0_002805 [Millerozyma farinosa CBS 7064]|uniref:Piso0_002805 protein n=1 Tax=Pichia sorbitophila (strain ATCC MYA-4447 / BCRC 22081 / CBS 7064 / NBRC 10061 / NRRL Y-12695) TaxID=559304 RepID=G8YDK0_PICSO|nr:Piso0_002805 [Millerozyma farinosa CBS 7064]